MALKKNNWGGIALRDGETSYKVLRYFTKYDSKDENSSSLGISHVGKKGDDSAYIVRKALNGKTQCEEKSTITGLKINFHTSGDYHVSGNGFVKGEDSPFKGSVEYRDEALGYYLALAFVTDYKKCPVVDLEKEKEAGKIDVVFDIPPHEKRCVFVVFVRINAGAYEISRNNDGTSAVVPNSEVESRVVSYLKGFLKSIQKGYDIDERSIEERVLAPNVPNDACVYSALCVPAIMNTDQDIPENKRFGNTIMTYVGEIGGEVSDSSQIVLIKTPYEEHAIDLSG